MKKCYLKSNNNFCCLFCKVYKISRASCCRLENGDFTMNKKDFFELTGENPEDILGNDWENIVDEMGEK